MHYVIFWYVLALGNFTNIYGGFFTSTGTIIWFSHHIRIYAVKCLMIELFKSLEGITPNYLSDLFVKAVTPYDTRDKNKLIQPLKRATTYGLRSFQYYGAHVWNMLPINIKTAHSLQEFKSLIRSWPGPTCSCHICTALLWLMLLLCIAHCGGGLSVWRLCGRLWVVVTTTCGAVESS